MGLQSRRGATAAVIRRRVFRQQINEGTNSEWFTHSTGLEAHRTEVVMPIEGSTILVTGGGSGLGAACVARFARQGANVIVADLNPPRDEAADNTLFAKTDVTSEADLRAAISAGVE